MKDEGVYKVTNNCIPINTNAFKPCDIHEILEEMKTPTTASGGASYRLGFSSGKHTSHTENPNRPKERGMFSEIKHSVYQLRFGACYQVCDSQLNTIMGSGSPAIHYGKYAEDKCILTGDVGQVLRANQTRKISQHKQNESKNSQSKEQEITLYAIIFPQGLLIENEIHFKSLRATITEKLPSTDIVVLSLKELIDKDPHNPSWDKRYTQTSTLYRTDQPRLVALQKDEIIGGEIIRGTPRPFQIEQGVYLF